MVSPSNRAFATLALVVGLASGWADNAFGALFQVKPTKLELSRSKASDLITILNESDESIRFQISVATWSLDESGEMRVEPTDELVAFPALLEVGPHSERRIRVGWLGQPGSTEKAFRVFFQELPDTTQPEQGVRFVTKMGVPVFVAPLERRAAHQIFEPSLDDGSMTLALENRGTLHFVVHGVRMIAENKDGEVVAARQLEGWYVLPGGRRTYAAPVSPEECKQIERIRAEVLTSLDLEPEIRVGGVHEAACRQ